MFFPLTFRLVWILLEDNIFTLPETSSSPLKIGLLPQKGHESSEPTIDFSGVFIASLSPSLENLVSGSGYIFGHFSREPNTFKSWVSTNQVQPSRQKPQGAITKKQQFSDAQAILLRMTNLWRREHGCASLRGELSGVKKINHERPVTSPAMVIW